MKHEYNGWLKHFDNDTLKGLWRVWVGDTFEIFLNGQEIMGRTVQDYRNMINDLLTELENRVNTEQTEALHK